jgi:RNA polymerase sigma factor (sigma-70 family)
VRLPAGCAARDEDAWVEFLRLFRGPLHAMAAKALRPDLDALEDVVQEALLRLVRTALRADRPAEVFCYLRRTVASVVADRHRRRGRDKRTETTVAPPYWPPPDPEEELLAKDGCRHLLARLAATERDTRIAYWAVVEGWTSREIAPAVGLSPSGVENALHRLRLRHRNGSGCQTP